MARARRARRACRGPNSSDTASAPDRRDPEPTPVVKDEFRRARIRPRCAKSPTIGRLMAHPAPFARLLNPVENLPIR